MNAAKHENRRQDFPTGDGHSTVRSYIPFRGSRLLCGQIFLSGILGWSSFAVGVHWLLPATPAYRAPLIDNSVVVQSTETHLQVSAEKKPATTNRHAELVGHRTR